MSRLIAPQAEAELAARIEAEQKLQAALALAEADRQSLALEMQRKLELANAEAVARTKVMFAGFFIAVPRVTEWKITAA